MTHFSRSYYETQYDIPLHCYQQEDAPVSFPLRKCSVTWAAALLLHSFSVTLYRGGHLRGLLAGPSLRKVIPGLYTHSHYFYTSAWTSSAGSVSPIVDGANAVHLFYEMQRCKRVGAVTEWSLFASS